MRGSSKQYRDIILWAIMRCSFKPDSPDLKDMAAHLSTELYNIEYTQEMADKLWAEAND